MPNRYYWTVQRKALPGSLSIVAITVGNIHLPLVPDKFRVMTGSHIIVQPDIVVLSPTNGNHRTFQGQSLPLETPASMFEPAPGNILAKDIGSVFTRLACGGV